MKSQNPTIIRALLPFWIYWSVLAFGCMGFFICPLILLLVLSLLLILLPIWLIIVYLIGNAVQWRTRLDKVGKRIALSFLCSFLVILIFPVGSWMYDTINWHTFHRSSLTNNFGDVSLWIIFIVHALVFWIGEELGNLASRQ